MDVLTDIAIDSLIGPNNDIAVRRTFSRSVIRIADIRRSKREIESS